MAGKKKVTEAQMLDAVRQTGHFGKAAEMLGINRRTIWRAKTENPKAFDEAYYEGVQPLRDLAISTLEAAMRERDQYGGITRAGSAAAIFISKSNPTLLQRLAIEHSEKPQPVREWRFVDPPKRKVSKNGAPKVEVDAAR